MTSGSSPSSTGSSRRWSPSPVPRRRTAGSSSPIARCSAAGRSSACPSGTSAGRFLQKARSARSRPAAVRPHPRLRGRRAAAPEPAVRGLQRRHVHADHLAGRSPRRLGVCSRGGTLRRGRPRGRRGLRALRLARAPQRGELRARRERQTQVQRGFYRIAQVLGSTLSRAETLDALAQAACDALGGDASLVLELRETP